MGCVGKPSLVGRPFRFPKIGMEENPLKIDILKQVATAYLVMKPGEDQYKVLFENDMHCEMEIKQAEGGAPALPAAEETNAKGDAQEAKAYLENHQVLQFVQAVLQ